jgi:penicillin-binding protein 2
MRNLEQRKITFYIIFALVAVVFLTRLFYLQVITTREVEAGRLEEIIYPSRGLIYDRYGELMVYNDAIYDLMIYPRQAKNIDTTKLCEVLEIKKEEFITRINTIVHDSLHYRSTKPYILEKELSAKMYATIQENLYSYPCLTIQTRTDRKYNHASGGHLLGFIREVSDQDITKSKNYYLRGESIGKSGVEKSYEDTLRGHKGITFFIQDVAGTKKGPYKEGKFDIPALPGTDLHLSISVKLQDYGEELMQNKVGSIVAIEPETGEILAMISSPGYDPNLLIGREKNKNYAILNDDPAKVLYNRPLDAMYPPGSIFKSMQALIGQQEKVLFPDTRYPCHRGYPVMGGKPGCHSHPSPLDLIQSVAYSCNSYYCYVFRSIVDENRFSNVEDGYRNWYDKIKQFGVGTRLGVDLPFENAGILRSADYFNKVYGKGSWKSSNLISLAIGQGELGITPMQMANVVCIIANRGYYLIPHAVKNIGEKGEIDKKYDERHTVAIDKTYFDYVVEGMYQVVNNGTASNCKIPGIIYCGKTGTAQNPHGKDHSVFMAFAPRDNPKIAIACVVENAGFGADWAGPIASLMIEKYLTDSVSRHDMEARMKKGNLMPAVYYRDRIKENAKDSLKEIEESK